MRNAVEEGPDVKIQHPVLFPAALSSHGQRVMGRTPRTVAVAVRVEDRLQLLLQQHRCRGLGDSVRHVRHTEHPDPRPMILRYLHRPHRAREIAARAHPVPQLVEVVPLRAAELGDADGVHARRSVVGPDLLPRLVNEALVDLKRLHLRRSVRPSAPPLEGLTSGDLTCPAPSLQPHYRTFIATTSRSAPVPRIGTLPLAVSPLGVLPLATGPANRTDIVRSSVSRRQVLLFHASACDELTPPIHRTPPGPHAGRPLAQGTPRGRAFVPGIPTTPGFDAIVLRFDASAVVHTCSSSRRIPDPLIAGLFRSRFPPRLLTGMTLRRFGFSACSANPEDLPPSLAQHASCWRPSTSSSLHFQDTRGWRSCHRSGARPGRRGGLGDAV